MWNWAGLDICETLEELVDPGHTALLLWDCTADALRDVANADALVASTARLLAAARARSVLTLYSRQNDMTWADLGPAMVRLQMRQLGIEDLARDPRANRLGAPPWEPPEALQPREGDVVFEKFSPNAFLGTSFEWRLRRHGIKTLLLAGAGLETGIDATVREAANRGYYAVVVRDCVGARSEPLYRLALDALETFDTYDSSEIVAAWETSGR
jgi:nicotinamidase-related amidase